MAAGVVIFTGFTTAARFLKIVMGGVADKHPAGHHHDYKDDDHSDHGDYGFDNIPINSNEGGEDVRKESYAEGVGRSEGAVLPLQSL